MPIKISLHRLDVPAVRISNSIFFKIPVLGISEGFERRDDDEANTFEENKKTLQVNLAGNKPI